MTPRGTLLLALLLPGLAHGQPAKPPATEDERNCALAAAQQVRINLRLDPLETRVRALRENELKGERSAYLGILWEVEIDAVSARIPVTYLFACLMTGDPPAPRVTAMGHRSQPPK